MSSLVILILLIFRTESAIIAKMVGDVRLEVKFILKETVVANPRAVAALVARILKRELVVELGRKERMFVGVEVRAYSETREGDEGWLAREGVGRRGLERG